MRNSFPLLFVALAAVPAMVKADLPDVGTDVKSQTNSPLTLKQIAQRGHNNYTATGTTAAANLAANAELRGTLEAEAALSTKHISALTLKRIAAIESKCDLTLAYSKPAVKGYFQMTAGACQDAHVTFTDIDEQSEWKKSCEAGRKFLDVNWQRIEDNGLTLTDGTKPTLTCLYLWHQQGPGAAPDLLKHLTDGTAKDKVASANMRNNVGPQALAAIDGPAGQGSHKMTELEFYAFWVGAINATMEAIH